MELRDHPLVSYRRLPSWPPTWSPAKPRTDLKPLRGEIGRLSYTFAGAKPDRFFLVIEHEGHPYVGCLFIEDRIFCAQIIPILEKQVGRTIKEIGDLELSFTL